MPRMSLLTFTSLDDINLEMLLSNTCSSNSEEQCKAIMDPDHFRLNKIGDLMQCITTFIESDYHISNNVAYILKRYISKRLLNSIKDEDKILVFEKLIECMEFRLRNVQQYTSINLTRSNASTLAVNHNAVIAKRFLNNICLHIIGTTYTKNTILVGESI